MMVGAFDWLPFSESLWRQFASRVSPERMSQMGLGVVGVTLSATTAVVLYLLRDGLKRWSVINRIGELHRIFGYYFVQEAHRGPEISKVRNLNRAYVEALLPYAMELPGVYAECQSAMMRIRAAMAVIDCDSYCEVGHLVQRIVADMEQIEFRCLDAVSDKITGR